MKKLMMLWLVLMFLGVVGNAEVVNMPDLSRPDSIAVDDQDIVITDGIHIYVYSQKDRKLRVKMGGKAGEGPQEFLPSPAPWIPAIRVYLKPDQFFVSGINKMLRFERSGKYIDEFRPIIPRSQYIPLEKKYVVIWFAEDKRHYITYSLYDSNKKLEKELLRMKSLDQDGKTIDPIAAGMAKSYFSRQVHGNHIFLISDDENIHVFNATGQKTATINPPYEKISLTAKDIEVFDQFFRKDLRFKEIYVLDHARVKYPSSYPLRKEYRVAQDRVYVISNKKKDTQYETFIYDFSGKLQKRMFLPLKDADPLELYPFAIHHNRIYQLIENDDEEIWQLHITEIK